MNRSLHRRLLGYALAALLLIIGVVAFDSPEPSAVALATTPSPMGALQTTNAATSDLLGGQDLVYACLAGGSYDLCLVPGDGSPEINLTNTPTLSESWPTWSPEGDRIAYSVRSASAPVTNVFAPAYSSIRVARVPPTADLQLGATIQVSAEAAPRGFMPAWSKTGKYLTYSRWVDEGETYNRAPIDLVLSVVRLADDRIVELGVVSESSARQMDSTWLPDDRMIWHEGTGQASTSPRAPISNLWSAQRGIDVKPTKLTNEGALSGISSSPGAVEPDVSPDGRTIAFIACEEVLQLTAACGFSSRALATMSVNGGDRDYLLDDGNGLRTPKWSPDSSLIAYSDKFGIQIYQVANGEVGYLTGSGEGAITPAWRPTTFGPGTARPVGADGAPQYFFDRGEPVNAAIDTLGADRVVVCLYDAISPVRVSTASRCFTATTDSQSVLEKSEPVGGTTWTVPLGIPSPDGDASSPLDDLPAGRWIIGVDRYDSNGLFSAEFTRPFSITCATSTCETIPFSRWSDRFQNMADLVERIKYLNSAVCWALELMIIGLTIVTAVNPLLAFVDAVIMWNASQLLGMLEGDLAKFLFQTGTGLVQAGGITLGPAEIGQIALEQRASATDETQRQRAEDVHTRASSGTGIKLTGVAVGAICFTLEQAFSAVIDTLQLVSDFFGRCADDPASGLCPAFLVGINTFAAPRGLRQVASTPSMEVSSSRSATGATEVGTTEFTSSPKVGLAVGALPAALGEPPMIDTTMPSEIADALETFALTREALGTVNLALGQLATPTAGGVDEQLVVASDAIGELLAAANTMDSLATAVEYDARSEGQPLSDPLVEPYQVDVIGEFQQRMATTGMTPSERQVLQDAGLSPGEIDVLIDGWAQRPVDAAELGRPTAEIAAEIAAVADELSTQLAAASLDIREGLVAVATGPLVADAEVVTAVGEQVSLLTPAFDPAGGELIVEIVDAPDNGLAQLLYDELNYVPAPDFVGTDSFSFRARSELGTWSEVATVTVEVLPTPPSPVTDDFGVRQGTSLTVPAPGVLGNDVTTNLPLTAALVDAADGGRLTFAPDGSFTYLPDPTTVGTVTFSYRARYPGSAWSDPVLVTIEVIDAADPPLAHSDAVSTSEDSAVAVSPLANDVDPDGDTISFVGFTQGSLGNVTCTSVGACTYTPDPDVNGSDKWTYTITDGTGRRSVGTVTVNVTPVEDAPRPGGDVLRFVKGVSGQLDLLANDIDPDGGAVTFAGVESAPTSGTLTCDPSGFCTYVPNDDTVAGDTATYVVRNAAGVTATASVDIRLFASFEEFASDGPILYIQNGATLGCGAEYIGDDWGSFFGEFACGTFLATGGALFGPTNIPGDGTDQPQPRTMFTPLRQSRVEGDGSFEDPFTVRTAVGAGGSGLELEQTDRYVEGDGAYRTDVVVTNTTGSPQTLTLWRAGDCQRADSDTGFGRLDTDSGLVGCVGADGRALDWVPLTPGSSAFEGDPIDLWAQIASQSPLPDTCRCAEEIDNAAGVSWTGQLAPGESATYSHFTVFSPGGLEPVGVGLGVDRPTVGRRGELRYTVELDNTANDRPVTLASLDVALPPGFTYVPGSTVGAGEPATEGRHLVWSSPMVLGSSATTTLEISVTAASIPGTFTAIADATSYDTAVIGGQSVDVVVTEGLTPVPVIVDAPAGPFAFDGSGSFDLDGVIIGWAWEFGDGGSGSGEIVEYTYERPGDYEVTLVVTDDRGDTASVSFVVNATEPANIAPQADFGYVVGGPRVDFDATASFDVDSLTGKPTAWTWDFGDGSSGSGELASRVFASDGTYEVTLTVTDADGATDALTRLVGVGSEENAPPVADVSITVDGLSVDFDGSGSSDVDGNVVSHEWDFGDEASGVGEGRIHVYPGPGTYLAQLVVVDDDGAVDSEAVSVTVTADDPTTTTSTTSTSTTTTSTTSTTSTTLPPTTSTTSTSTTSTSTTSTSTTSTSTTSTTVPPTTSTIPPPVSTTSTTVPPTTSTTAPPSTSTSTTSTTLPPTSTSTTTTSPVPTLVPTEPSPTLTATPSLLTPGQLVTLVAEGFAPRAHVTFQYNPVIGTRVADDSGTAVLIAGGIPQPGDYTIVASSPDGRRASTVVTVVTAEPAPLTTVAGVLPATGSDTDTGLWSALALILAGGALLLVSRRRRSM